MAYNTFGMNRGYGNLGNDLDVIFGTLDLGTVITEAAALATDSTNLTAESGSLTTGGSYITGTLTLGHTLVAGDITELTAIVGQIGSLATTAANIATESGSITAAAGTVNQDIFLAVNTTNVKGIMDVYQAMKTLDLYFLSGKPIGNTNIPQGAG
jgi:hypothetical protein